jgi:quercetin dioxygenase-like cupin family protein
MTTQTHLTLVNNLFVKMFVYKDAGDVNPGGGHKHNHDHITLLARGSLLMETEAGVETHVAPKLFVTKKGVPHKFTALEENTVMCCVQAIRDGEEVGDVAPYDISPEKAFELWQKFPLSTPP